jgi:chromosome segregation ATPase
MDLDPELAKGANSAPTPPRRNDGVSRAAELRSEIGALVKERERVRRELDQLRADCGQLRDRKELADDNKQLKTENESLRATLARVDPADYERLKKEEAERIATQKAAWNGFLEKCERLRQANPDFDACLQAIRDIPESWIRAISSLANGAEFILWLGRSPQFRAYLSELKEPVAVQRIQEAAFDLRKLS